MPIEEINTGIVPNDGTGDDLYTTGNKINNNFQVQQAEIDQIVVDTENLVDVFTYDAGTQAIWNQLDTIVSPPDYTTAGLVYTTTFDNATTGINTELNSLQSQIDSLPPSNDYTTAGLVYTTTFDEATTGINQELANILSKIHYDVSFAVSDELSDLVVSQSTQVVIVRNVDCLTIVGGVNTAPSGANLIVTITKNGGAFATLTITAGNTLGSVVPTSGSISENDVIVATVTQVGSTTAGAGLKVYLKNDLV